MNEEDVVIIDLEEVNADDLYVDIDIPSLHTADVPQAVPPTEDLSLQVSDTLHVSTAATTVTTIPVPLFSNTEAGGSSAGTDADERMKRMVEEHDHFLESSGLREFVDDFIDDDDDVDVVELKRKVLLLEQEQIIKTLEISRLQEENKDQCRCITKLQSMIGELSAKLLDSSQCLEANLGSDFASAQTQVETVQSPSAGAASEREINQSTTKAPRSPVRIVDKFEDTMNTPGMRSYFAFRKNGELEYYENCKAFQSLTIVDLRELSEAPFHAFDMVSAASRVRTHKVVVDPSTGKPLNTVVGPPTQKAKIIPLPTDLHDGLLSDFKYWYFGLRLFVWKNFTAAISQIVSSEMWAGNQTGAETQIFGHSFGLTVEDMQQVIKSTKKGKGLQNFDY
ncbi:hypothetical protein QVD17_38236 [Tagetes erecta]|uniref:Uncharacterized protein n=1 Tax=Tagetes erecta TaxID=13708 RepID=A0AAD8NKQ9_TARER|nr:hypothetical protein QVD17_38236 [Tagetes erecta]